jgi:hypothetical protein
MDTNAVSAQGVRNLEALGCRCVGKWVVQGGFGTRNGRSDRRAKPELYEMAETKKVMYAHVFRGRILYIGEACKRTCRTA